MNYYTYTMNNFTNITYHTYTTPNKVLQFRDQLYCVLENGTIYKCGKDQLWTVMPITALPDQVEVKDGGLYIDMKLQSEKYQQGEYIGNPVEEVTNTCLCPMQALMAEGCKCGGE